MTMKSITTITTKTALGTINSNSSISNSNDNDSSNDNSNNNNNNNNNNKQATMITIATTIILARNKQQSYQ